MGPVHFAAEHAQRATRRIIEALAAGENGGKIRKFHVQQADASTDLLAEAHGKNGRAIPLVFHIHRVSPAAAFTLEAYLLRGDLVRQEMKLRKVEPVLVLFIQNLTEKTAERVYGFIARRCPRLHIMVISDRGGQIMWLPSLDVDFTGADVARIRSAGDLKASTSKGGTVLSDKDQWLLKHLIYAKAPDRTWWGQIPRSIATTAEWIEGGRTGSTTVYRLRDRLIDRGVLDGSRHGQIHLVAPGRLLEDWLAQARLDFPDTVAVMPLFGAVKEKPAFDHRWAWLRKNIGKRSREEYAISGWFAANRHDMSHVIMAEERSIEITVRDDMASICNDWKLSPCHPKDAWFVLSSTRAPTSVFSSSLNLVDLWVVDLWQSALDTAHDPARGMEQAEFIMSVIAETLQ